MKVQSKASSSTATPKAPRPTPPPRPTGSGLLSSSDLFGGPSANEDSARKGVTIDIQIRLDPKGGNTINIAQEITKKYGRDAINPRAAAHREQLLQIAAAANKIDGGSADDMSVDLMSELDGDSNVEMGGMDDDKSAVGENGDKPKRRTRTKKAEEYDKEDDFIDDTELAWQEQAAVAKDGFFVYSGPLIPEGEKASVETCVSLNIKPFSDVLKMSAVPLLPEALAAEAEPVAAAQQPTAPLTRLWPTRPQRRAQEAAAVAEAPASHENRASRRRTESVWTWRRCSANGLHRLWVEDPALDHRRWQWRRLLDKAPAWVPEPRHEYVVRHQRGITGRCPFTERNLNADAR